MSKAILTGEKVYFRFLEKEDINRGWLKWVNDPSITMNMCVNPPITEKELSNYFEKMKPPNAVMFAVCLLENDEYIGNAKIGPIDWRTKTASCGRMIGKSNLHRKGIGTDVLKLLLTYGFEELNLNRMQTGVAVSNIGSIKSNKRAGMHEEGIRRQAAIVDGAYADVALFGMLRNDFLSKINE